MGTRVPLGCVGCVGCVGCGLESVYACTSDAQCSDVSRVGHCELDGYCSFDDEVCPSGRRYGRWSGGGLANLCVEDGAAATSTSASSSGPQSSEGGDTGLRSTSGPGSDSTARVTTADPTLAGTTSSSTGDASESSSTGSEALDPDLVAWYRFEDIADGAVLDSSGNGHTATCVECPALVDGVEGSAVDLDGVGQFLTVANDEAFALQTWTISAWLWLNEPTTTFRTVVGKPLGTGTENSFELGVAAAASASAFSGWSDGQTSQTLSRPVPGFGRWFHVAATLSPSDATLYLDGEAVEAAEIVIVTDWDDQDVYIGADVDDEVLENFFFGRIDELQVYRRALSSAEIAIVMSGRNL